MHILILCCGNGSVVGHLAALGPKVTGIDATADGIQLATTAHPDVRFFVRRVFEDLTDLREAFDVVVSAGVVEHLYQLSASIRQAKLTLRPGGALILSTPYHGYL